MAPSIIDNMERTVEATIDGFNKIDYESLRATRSDDFVYQFLPLSLGTPPRDNEQYKEFFLSTFMKAFQKFKITKNSTIYDSDAKKAALHGRADVQSLLGPASIEFVMMLSFDEKGDKVKRIDEFFDSAVYVSFFTKLQEHMSQKNGESLE